MKPQKAKHLHLEMEKKRPACLGHDYMVFEKHDGWYGYMDHKQPIMSRQMRAIPSLAKLSKELNNLNAAVSGRLIFEIMVEGMSEFKDMNGYLNRHAEAKNAYLLVHDCVPDDLSMPFHERYQTVLAAVLGLQHPKVRLAKCISYNSNRLYEWKALAELEWSKGNEGVILKQRDAGYSPGSRNADILKIKEELTLDLMVIGVEEGEGKYEGTLGTLRVMEGTGQEHLISGMTDAERDFWWAAPGAIIGSVVEVKAMKRLANGSLREPRFKAIRHDKTIEDID